MHYRILPRALRSDSVRAWRGVILAAILALVLLATWAFVLHVEARRQAQREAGRGAAALAQSVAREHERQLDTARQLLLALSQRPEVLGANSGACAALVEGIVRTVSGYLDLVALRPNGEALCAARSPARLPAGLDATDLRRTVESGATTLGRYAIDRPAGRATVALASAVVDDGGVVRSVVVASLDLGQLERAVVETPLPVGAAMMLVDGNGVILSHYPSPERWRGEIIDDALKPRLPEHGVGLVETPWLEGVPSLVLAEPLLRDAGRARDITVVVALPRRAVFGDADRLFGLELAGLGLLALALLVCGALVIARLVARPAQGMLRVIRSLNSGDVRARMRRGDARAGLIGRLARSVNLLGRRLEEHQQAAQHLEEQLRSERATRLLATVTTAASTARPDDDPEPATPVLPTSVATATYTPPALEPAALSDECGWGLREPPFDNAPNPRFLWPSPGHSDALVRLTYALRQRRGCAILTGEPGCGKTLLTRAVVQRLEPSRYEIGLLTNPHGGRLELLRHVLYELGVESAETARAELLHAVHELVVTNARRGRETLVIVDDAQQAEDPAWFEELSSLLNIQTNERTLVTLLLAGTPDLTAAIHRVQHLDRRVSVRCALAPLNPEQTAQYISYRLSVAGGDASLFSRDAVVLVHQASRGVPRAINDVCDSAMLLARLDGLSGIDGALVRRVLGATPTAAETSPSR
jgi:type II secretory pathway predicted ATPase ExeA/HAMP domain-containing protein